MFTTRPAGSGDQLAQRGHSADEQRQGAWAYEGIDYHHPGDAWLAHNAAANRYIQRRTAWEERTWEEQT